MTSPCAVYEFRHNAEGYTQEQIKALLQEYCKKWCFQLEKGDTGYLHYQGHFSLVKKRRKAELLKVLPIKFMHLAPLHATEDSHLYSLKTDTRVDGPWKDTDEVIYIPKQYLGLEKKLYPYQQEIWDAKNDYSRHINLIYCPTGRNGKSTIASLMDLHKKGLDLPPVNDMKELIQIACDICMAKQLRDPGTVFIDLPRAMKKDTLFGMYSAIEQIKKGKLYDMRYHYKEWWIDSPIVWVFTNMEPDTSMMSMDRWKIWTISDTKTLQKYEICEI